MAAFPDILTEFSWRLGDNPGFILLNSLMKAAGFSAQSFVLFYSSLFVASAVTFLKRYSSNFTLSIFLFVCAHGYLFSLAAMKQCTSIAIGLAAIPYALNHKWIRFAAIVLLAATFHPYILLFLLIPILRFKPWSGGTWLLLALTVIAGLTLPNIVETIVNTAALLGDGYNAEEFIGEGVNVFRVLVASVPDILFNGIEGGPGSCQFFTGFLDGRNINRIPGSPLHGFKAVQHNVHGLVHGFQRGSYTIIQSDCRSNGCQ